MKKSLLKGLLLILFSTTCFACTNGIESLTDASIPVIDSSPALVADVKATTHFLGWGNVGDTTIRVKADKDILPAVPLTKPNLAAITSNLEGGFRMLSVGGSLSAGFRDGGLYREGQLTAFPNLIARQMGILFYQPLFDPTEGNGSGYKVLTGTEPIASFKMVTNNLGYVENKAEKFKKFNGSNLDNYAFPGMDTDLGQINLLPDDQSGKKFSERIFNSVNQEPSFIFQSLKAQSNDFFIFEAGFDNVVASIMHGGGGSIQQEGENSFRSGGTLLIKNFANNKSKGVLLNVPNILDIPYFSQITNEKIKKLAGVVIRVQRSSGSEYYRDFNPSIDRLIPTPTVEKLLKGEIKGLALLNDRDVLSKDDGDDEWSFTNTLGYNVLTIEKCAKDNNLAIVDINSLYKKIMTGAYTTDDGVKVDANWKTGNFFSSDGIYPTAFGQAVIANEVIKTINQHYKLTIPLINTRFFLKK
jgi:hypothetical protein